MQTPPLSGSRASTSSGTLRGWSQTARADEWLKMTGAVADVERVAHGGGGDVGEVDQHAEPVHLGDHLAAEGGQPAVRGSSVAESAQSVFSLWVRVR